MTRRDIIMSIIDTTEINPEVIRVMGSKKHTIEELKEIISQILNDEPKKEKVAWSFGGIRVSN